VAEVYCPLVTLYASAVGAVVQLVLTASEAATRVITCTVWCVQWSSKFSALWFEREE